MCTVYTEFFYCKYRCHTKINQIFMFFFLKNTQTRIMISIPFSDETVK